MGLSGNSETAGWWSMADRLPLRIEFVCTANISRSPYAEQSAASLCNPALAAFRSSGVRARHGDPMDTQMVAELQSRGVHPGPHASRPLDSRGIASADLILTMEAAHRNRILEHWPESIRKTFTITQFVSVLATLPLSGTGGARRGIIADAFARRSAADAQGDVTDPFGREPRIAAEVAEQLDDLVWALAQGLQLAHLPRRGVH